MATRNNQPTYDGFLNIRLTDKNGTIHAFKTGVALHLDRKLDAAILKDPGIIERALAEGRISMSVWIPEAESNSTADFG